MPNQLEVYKCTHCGNIVEVIHGGGAGLVCCGENMKLMKEGSTDGAMEKHVPVIEKIEGGYKVTVGSVAHPMDENHYIEWIELLADGVSHIAFLNPGDEVLVPDPVWLNYIHVPNFFEAVPVSYPLREENDFQIDLKQLEALITDKTRMLVINSPGNPTGVVQSYETLKGLADLAIRHDLIVVSDEIYEKLVYDGAKHFSVASISQEVKDRTVTVNGFSKAYAMTGWRIGYAAARADVVKGIMAVQSQTTSATSAISQKAAVEALRGPQHDLEVMVEEFKRRKDYVVDRLNKIPGITCPDVKGAFYVYPDVQPYLGKSFGGRKIETAVELCQYLLDEALISTVPGEAYNVPGKIRISYSNSMENLEKALDRMEQALAALH